MDLFGATDFDGHEQVVHAFDKSAGLQAIIAIHDTRLGPAIGGCRMWPYANGEEALADVLRLSRGMTYKAAMAGLPFGGGKAVIIGDSRKDKTPALLRAFGRAVDRLAGRYYAGEDVGMSTADMDVAGRVTPYVLGRSGKGSGDPSPWTARGVLMGMRAAAMHGLGKASLEGLTVAIQGLGHVGMAVARLLHEQGVTLIVADIDRLRVAQATRNFGATVVPVDAFTATRCDILAPCALGGTISKHSLPTLDCRIVAGSANNQLDRAEDGDLLHERNILYAPDYVINAGGLINIAHELLPGGHSPAAVERALATIGRRLNEVFLQSRERQQAPHRIADAMAELIIRGARPVMSEHAA